MAAPRTPKLFQASLEGRVCQVSEPRRHVPRHEVAELTPCCRIFLLGSSEDGFCDPHQSFAILLAIFLVGTKVSVDVTVRKSHTVSAGGLRRLNDGDFEVF